MDLRFAVGTDNSASQPAEKGHGRTARRAEMNDSSRGGERPCSLPAMSSGPKRGPLAFQLFRSGGPLNPWSKSALFFGLVQLAFSVT